MLGLSLGERFELVGSVADAEEAVEFARTIQPEVALVDVEMPKGGGLRALTGILEAAPNTAVVMLSADESDRTVREFIQAGATAYCRKGMASWRLAECLNQAIKAHHAERREHPEQS